VPNAFISNGAKKTFKPITKFEDEINWEIYNRYGEKIFFTNSITSEWDGTFNFYNVLNKKRPKVG